ncbi:DUF1295 domain-containing protein [Williamsia sp. CHRR-6]|uniref:DUF1295 domain-containing protein n=1 Tax=Williamsia sp. CHRR-6 TaxID=2835871 RepID=UPI001BD9BEA9|nr:DUF1295 domain-containing protein [Williamsia sp. CHRR-6]MBT0566510.1 DUF1295 domain-containing protein [Williamsia sp. CHRR-6]
MNSGAIDFDWARFGVVVGASLAATLVFLGITAVIGFRIGRHNVVDVTWGSGFVVIAAVSAAVGNGDLWRRLLVFALVAVWGLRLSGSLLRRTWGKGEDPRYTALLDKAPGNRTWAAITKIYLTQAPALWFVSLPVQVSAAAHGELWVFAVIGSIVWAVGLTFEAVGDWQMDRYKADPHRPPVMDRGLWRYTRHPNYFGDACVWWGIFLVCLTFWPTVATIASPIAMTYFLVFATGARLLEKHMATRPGYPEYQQRTSYFIPWPPKKAVA